MKIRLRGKVTNVGAGNMPETVQAKVGNTVIASDQTNSTGDYELSLDRFVEYDLWLVNSACAADPATYRTTASPIQFCNLAGPA